MKNKEKKQTDKSAVDQKINRKQAIKRAGFYAVTTAGMITLLGSPKRASASPADPTPWPQG